MDGKEGGNIWTQLLQSLAPKDVKAYILLVGSSKAGKRSLVTALAERCGLDFREEDPGGFLPAQERAGRFDYAFLDMAETGREGRDLAHVWILGDKEFGPLLRSQLTPDKLSRLCAVVCTSMSSPHTIVEQLQHWDEYLRDLLSPLLLELPLAEQDALRARSAEHCSPADGDLPAGVLQYNLGVPIIHCVQSAEVDADRKAMDVWFRKNSVPYGATLAYWEEKEGDDPTVAAIYEYLRYLLFRRKSAESGDGDRGADQEVSRFDVPVGAQMKLARDDSATSVTRDALGTPAEGFTTPYEVMVKCPIPTITEETAVEAEPMDSFLKKLSQANAGERVEKTTRVKPTELLAHGRDRKLSDLGAQEPGKRTTVTQGDNTQLANFFQNLLTRGQSDKSGARAKAATPQRLPTRPRPAGES